jgi:hypothetical protein
LPFEKIPQLQVVQFGSLFSMVQAQLPKGSWKKFSLENKKAWN